MIKQKKCDKCGIVKSGGEFYKRRASPIGIRSECKLCSKKRAKKYYWTNRNRLLSECRERDRNRPDLVRARVKRYEKKHPEKVRAHGVIKGRIRRGELQRGCCDICGRSNAEAHHPDYNQPDNVIWLCRLHHRRLHYESSKMVEHPLFVGVA